jgi:predicted lipoprotein with Yx(FWY)xxD motif
MKLVQNPAVGGQIIVSDAGISLYLYEPDGSNQTSQVPAGIRSNWPAVVAADPAHVTLAGFDPSKLGVAQQPDGNKQLMYNGHLLYTFSGDASPGDANGQRLGGIWFTLSPTGDKNP